MTTARTQPARIRLPIDSTLLVITLALIAVGLLMVMDSSYAKSLDSVRGGHSAFTLFLKQLEGAVLGLGVLYFFLRVGYWKLRRHAFKIMIGGLLLLAAVYIPHIGVAENGAHRWVKLGTQFQSSEIAKLALLIYLAALLSRPDANLRRLSHCLVSATFVMVLYCVAIEREPDMGTAVVLCLAGLTQLFLAGVRKRHVLLIVVVLGLGGLVIGLMFKHRQHRIDTWLHPAAHKTGVGYQEWHARMAVGSGEWWGLGLGRGREKYYLPESESDFIFANIAEESGFAGSVALLGVLLALGGRAFWIASRTQDRFGQLLAAGIASIISWQALINVATATATIPATGVPLPFISYGSTSLVILLAEIGILLNIARHPTPPGQPVRSKS